MKRSASKLDSLNEPEKNPKKAKYTSELDVQSCINAMQENPSLKLALSKFKKISLEEIERLVIEEGVEYQTAVSQLFDKITSEKCEPPLTEIQFVMQHTGFNSLNAIRALLMKEELVKLRQKGLDPPQAIDELIVRMKSLSGTKRKYPQEFEEDSTIENKNSVNINEKGKANNFDLISNKRHRISIDFFEKK